MKTKSKYRYFLGVDISKDTLDCTLLHGPKSLFHQKLLNQASDIKPFLQKILATEGINKANLVCGMENTGYYGNPLIQALSALKIRYVSGHALTIKRSIGMVRGKSDKSDSLHIAMHFYRCRDLLKESIPRRAIIDKLAMLASMRERLVKLSLQVKTPLGQSKGFIASELQELSKRLCGDSVSGIQADLQRIEKEIQQTWRSDENTHRLMKLMLTVPSVGEVTALQILICTNEFQQISGAKQFACYAGFAPFPYSSGTTLEKGTRTSKLCNKRMKSLIRTCAISASRFIPDLKEYYLRKQAEGKHKMSVLNAIGFKVIARVFTCVKQNRVYQKEYTRAPNIN